jgi:hypothetical protein
MSRHDVAYEPPRRDDAPPPTPAIVDGATV